MRTCSDILINPKENYFICKIGLDGGVGGFSFADNRRNPRTVHLQGGHGQRE